MTLLGMMVGSGVASGLVSFSFGREALKGVTQPDVSPTKKLASENQNPAAREGLILLKENDILNQVNAHIRNNGKSPEPKKKEPSFIQSTELEADSLVEVQNASNNKLNLPLKSEDEGVLLEVVNVTQKGGSLLLDVNLKNNGVRAVRFLYSFLEVKDERGRSLSAITEGLPGELPANGLNFSGTIKIPTALLENAQKLSLTLTDYPDQKLALKLSAIPVVK